MNKLIEQLDAVLPQSMTMPEPLKQLYQWIEDNGFYQDNDKGVRIGSLYSDKKLDESWTDDGRDGGTLILFAANRNDSLKYWFGKESDEITSRLCVFARSGAEGSQCALWKDDNGDTKIVHMGSGSGSVLTCVLADNAVDFLRLLAIGYDEICWNECFAYPPNEDKDNGEFIVKPNIEFQNWVKSTFNVDIPKTALEIVKHPAEMGDDDSEDAFCNWVESMLD